MLLELNWNMFINILESELSGETHLSSAQIIAKVYKAAKISDSRITYDLLSASEIGFWWFKAHLSPTPQGLWTFYKCLEFLKYEDFGMKRPLFSLDQVERERLYFPLG